MLKVGYLVFSVVLLMATSHCHQALSVTGTMMDMCSPPTETVQSGIHEKQGNKSWSFLTSQQQMEL